MIPGDPVISCAVPVLAMNAARGRRAGMTLARCPCMSQAAHQPVDTSTSALAQGERAEVEAYYRAIAPFYDAELANRQDLAFWRDIGARHRGGRFLELGAGSGRVSAALAPFASALVAIDISPELLRLARPRLARWPHAHVILA